MGACGVLGPVSYMRVCLMTWNLVLSCTGAIACAANTLAVRLGKDRAAWHSLPSLLPGMLQETHPVPHPAGSWYKGPHPGQLVTRYLGYR